MKLNLRLLLVILTLAAAALACQAASSGSDSSTSEEASAPSQPSPTPKPKPLYEDDFSNSSSGWDDIEDEEGITGYRNGGYQFLVNKVKWYFWSTPGVNFTDVVIDVDATKQGGPDKNEFGIVCRYIDENNFYYFTISSDGYYGISKFVNNEGSLIGMDKYQLNDTAIRTGAATNHIQASCVGSNLMLTVNGTVLADVQDTDITGGDVGLIAGTYDEIGVDILFDNFVVMRP